MAADTRQAQERRLIEAALELARAEQRYRATHEHGDDYFYAHVGAAKEDRENAEDALYEAAEPLLAAQEGA